MAVLRSPLFVVCLVLFVLHLILQKVMHIRLGWADNYLDSLLAMPVILSLWLAERQWLFKRGSTYRLSPLHVLLATLYIAFITEGLFPLLSARFTADWLDVACYAAGSFVFYFTINRTAPIAEVDNK